MSTWLDKLLGGHKDKAQKTGEEVLDKYKDKLMSIVYDKELVDELAPIFAKLHTAEGFDKVFELLETKEQQINAISGGDWFEQQTGDDDKEIDTQDSKDKDEPKDKPSLSAEEILKQKYNPQ